MHDDDMVKRLGIEGQSKERIALQLEQVRTLVGEAISARLTPQQVHEYEAIINNDQTVITKWLQENMPEYKTTFLFHQLQETAHDDPEHNSSEKLFASLAWVNKNVPDVQTITDSVIEQYKSGHVATA